MVDVRDAAAVIAAALTPEQGPRRYVVPGHHVDGHLLYRTLSRATGRRLPHLVLPAGLVSSGARMVDAMQRRLPSQWAVPTYAEGVEVVRRNTRLDDSPARTEFGIEPRPLVETFRDTIRWMVTRGVLPARYAGRLAPVLT